MRRPLRSLLLVLAVAACADRDAPAADGADLEARERATRAGSATATAEWPEDGPVHLQRERPIDLTGDGTAEIVSVRAQGERYDSLDIALTITSGRDTLWHDGWSSRHYFRYDPLEGKADSTVRRIVREHVDALLGSDRFSERGLPQPLAQGTGSADMMREAVQYHLAELDWRGGADLNPADATPPDAHSRIDASRVSPDRVDVVIRELSERPAFWYYAGGEVTNAIAWSEREHAFVRIHSCC